MKHLYSFLSKTLLMAGGILAYAGAQAQNPSSTAAGNCAALVQNFNDNSGGHASPSIYGGTFDEAFYYQNSIGYWTENFTGRTGPANAGRVITIISPPYVNPNPESTFDVGFWFQTSNATTDRFQVRLVQLKPGPAGTTITDVVASTGLQTFANWSTNVAPSIDASNAFNSGDTGRVCIRLLDQDIVNSPNTFYRVEIAYVVAGTNYAAYDNLSIGAEAAAGPLPVNFIGIVGSRVDNGVLVRWDIADENNVREYQLEKSTDGRSFNTVGTVAASNKTAYSFTDQNDKFPALFYRVKSVDLDGRTKYSGIIRMQGNNSFGNGLRIYPSPAKSDISVQHAKLENNARVTISTMDGRIIKTVTPARGASNTMINVSSLSSGMYILRIENGNGKVESSTFVKQ